MPTCRISFLLEKDLHRVNSLLAALCGQRFRLVDRVEAGSALENRRGPQYVECRDYRLGFFDLRPRWKEVSGLLVSCTRSLFEFRVTTGNKLGPPIRILAEC